jgi:hypothetical protein
MKISTPRKAAAAGGACVLMTLGAASVATADTHTGAATPAAPVVTTIPTATPDTTAARAPASYGRGAGPNGHHDHGGRAAHRDSGGEHWSSHDAVRLGIRAADRRANVGAPDADGYSMKMNITNKTGGPLTLVSYGEWSHNHWHQRPQQTLADSSSETLTNYSDWGGDGMSVEYQTSNGTDLYFCSTDPILGNGSDTSQGTSSNPSEAVVSWTNGSGDTPTDSYTVFSPSYGYTGAAQTYRVPDNVTSLKVTAAGGTGGYGDNGDTEFGGIGGAGGEITGTLQVTPGEQLNVYVGGNGTNGQAASNFPCSSCTTGGVGGWGGPGGANSGGNGGGYQDGTFSYAGGGGGATVITDASGNTLLSVAGGGGGGDGFVSGQGGDGGDGGSLPGNPGQDGIGLGVGAGGLNGGAKGASRTGNGTPGSDGGKGTNAGGGAGGGVNGGGGGGYGIATGGGGGGGAGSSSFGQLQNPSITKAPIASDGWVIFTPAN